jgi:DNA ligase D-like protein (predicted 3'-phosphoesterase)
MPIFVVHHHLSKKEHYDFRLEMDKVLKSWAVPKQPPKTKGIKRLAIQVEDHALSYADFEGAIPEGMYGAGKVEIWDKGEYEIKEKAENKLVFELFGKKLKGEYILIKLKPNPRFKSNSWLLFKK